MKKNHLLAGLFAASLRASFGRFFPTFERADADVMPPNSRHVAPIAHSKLLLIEQLQFGIYCRPTFTSAHTPLSRSYFSNNNG